MNRSLQRIAVVTCLLGVLCALEATHLTSLNGWAEIGADVPYVILFAAYLATWLATRGMRGGARRLCLLVGSVATGCLFDLWLTVGTIVWVVLLHRALFGGGRAQLRRGVAFTAVSTLVLALVCSRDLWPEFLDSHRVISRWGYLFAVAYTFRIAWLLHQVRMQRLVVPLVDLVLYFVFAPFFVIVPYMLAIPRCDRFCAGLDAHDAKIEASGIRLLAWGVLLTAAASALHRVYDPNVSWIASLRAHDAGRVALHSLAYYPLNATLNACAIAAVLVGMVRLLGIELGPSFDSPLLSTSMAELWRRWNTHFRDLLVELFYMPVAMRLRRKPERAIVMSCIAVFVVGSTLFHLPKHYFRYGSIYPPNLHIVVENVIMCAIVAFALVREARQRKAGIERPPGGPVRKALCMARTWVVMLVVTIYGGYGSQYAAFGERPPLQFQSPKGP